MANYLVEVNGVTKRFGEIRAVDGVDLAVRPGEIFGLIGHNGAGKSTLFKMMLGLLPLSGGEIRISGKPVRGEAFRQVRRGIGYLPENVVFYDNLTGLETLNFFAGLKGVGKGDGLALLDKVGLAHAANRRVRGYSKGMRQRLGFAQALLGKPALLFLDEPTTGLDPEGILEFYRILRDMRGQGVTVILTSHILAEIQERVDRLAIMKTGKIQAIGTVQGLREEMKLPILFRIRMTAGCMPELRSLLAPLGVAEVEDEDEGEGEDEGESVRVSCPREKKMAVLSALAALGGKVADLNVREPSLEDVFFGYAG